MLVVVILSVLVFCLFNFRTKAKCFAGDVGSIGMAMILVFAVGRLMLATGDVTWIVLFLVYGVDGMMTIFHRIMLHENLGEAHRKHGYQLMANELKMPIMIHSRDANQLTMDILTEEGAFSEERKSWFPMRPSAGTLSADAYRQEFSIPGESAGFAPDARVQMHCYSGSPEMAEEYVKLGATISLGGPITFKNGRKAAEVARRIPIEFLLSETDAPYMAPEPLRGRPNKPHYVEHVVRRMAMIKGVSYGEMSRIFAENGKRFFDIP
jgi:hypothetical protein